MDRSEVGLIASNANNLDMDQKASRQPSRGWSTLLNDSLDDCEQLFAAPENEAAEASHDIAKLLQQLPERQRLPIQYVKVEGGSVADTAKRTGMSESSVKIGIHRGPKAPAASIRTLE
jgi:RNA polymerase sigma-70 factor, ECF subfamily